jgi:hypothetical protein
MPVSLGRLLVDQRLKTCYIKLQVFFRSEPDSLAIGQNQGNHRVPHLVADFGKDLAQEVECLRRLTWADSIP